MQVHAKAPRRLGVPLGGQRFACPYTAPGCHAHEHGALPATFVPQHLLRSSARFIAGQERQGRSTAFKPSAATRCL